MTNKGTTIVRKPRIPTKSEQPLMGIHTKKDFIKTNANESIMSVPRKPQPIYADTKSGDKQLLENSGLVPKYIKKKVHLELQLHCLSSR